MRQSHHFIPDLECFSHYNSHCCFQSLCSSVTWPIAIIHFQLCEAFFLQSSTKITFSQVNNASCVERITCLRHWAEKIKCFGAFDAEINGWKIGFCLKADWLLKNSRSKLRLALWVGIQIFMYSTKEIKKDLGDFIAIWAQKSSLSHWPMCLSDQWMTVVNNIY